MSDSNGYQPPKVWTWDAGNDGEWAKLNRPVAGATHEATLTQGKHPLQLYSVATPNGQKVTILLEELLALGETGAEYDAHLVRITEGAQFSSGFVEINPNSKIPAMLDTETGARVFESGAILLYLAENSAISYPKNCLNAPKHSTGCSGYRVRPHIWAAILGTSTPTPPKSSSTHSIGSLWK